jgi:hypothetical protein
MPENAQPLVKHIHYAKISLLVAALALLPAMQGRLANFETRVLASHNEERARLRLPALAWSNELATGAQDWASYLAMTGKFEHSPNIKGQPLQGENIWGGTIGAYHPENMIGLWISEKSYYVPGTFPSNSASGRVEDVSHYTQLIWRQTRQVGCAVAEGQREEILVCRYSEPGNIIGRRPI